MCKTRVNDCVNDCVDDVLFELCNTVHNVCLSKDRRTTVHVPNPHARTNQ